MFGSALSTFIYIVCVYALWEMTPPLFFVVQRKHIFFVLFSSLRNDFVENRTEHNGSRTYAFRRCLHARAHTKLRHFGAATQMLFAVNHNSLRNALAHKCVEPLLQELGSESARALAPLVARETTQEISTVLKCWWNVCYALLYILLLRFYIYNNHNEQQQQYEQNREQRRQVHWR